jgi:hypothetical protein
MIRRFILCCFFSLLGYQAFAGGDASAPGDSLINTIKWKTATEVDSYGYDVYRGDSEGGPFVKLTDAPLPGAGTVDTPQSYVFVDDTIAPDTVYYYYVESISMDGVREKLTPVFASKPKSRPSE